MDNFSFINVPFDKAEKIVVSFKERGSEAADQSCQEKQEEIIRY